MKHKSNSLHRVRTRQDSVQTCHCSTRSENRPLSNCTNITLQHSRTLSDQSLYFCVLFSRLIPKKTEMNFFCVFFNSCRTHKCRWFLSVSWLDLTTDLNCDGAEEWVWSGPQMFLPWAAFTKWRNSMELTLDMYETQIV